MIKIVKINYIPPKVTTADFRVEDAMTSFSVTGTTQLDLLTEFQASTSSQDNSYFGNSSFGNISWDE